MQPERKGGDNRPTATARGIYTLNKCFLFNNGLCGFRVFSRLFNTFLLCLRYLYIASSAPFCRVLNAFSTYFRLSFPCLLRPLGGVSVSPDSLFLLPTLWPVAAVLLHTGVFIRPLQSSYLAFPHVILNLFTPLPPAFIVVTY